MTITEDAPGGVTIDGIGELGGVGNGAGVGVGGGVGCADHAGTENNTMTKAAHAAPAQLV